MAPRPAVRIVLSGRPVVAAGAPFVPYEEPLSDVGVALDWISDLRPSVEPMVLRARMERGPRAEAAQVNGDWLCLADGSTPVRIPRPVWSYDGAARRWTEPLTWLSAWETCVDARWMLYAAGAVGVKRRPLALAACACARTALRFVHAADRRPLRAIEAAEAWASGAMRVADAWEEVAAVNASISDAASIPGRDAANAAACAAAIAAYVDAPDAPYAADSAAAAVYHASGNDASARSQALREMADLVRSNIPTLAVLRAAIVRG